MKTLVTGGCGFIGSHMVDRLLADGHEVCVIDNLSSGNIRNLEHHKGNPKLQVHIHHIADHEKIEGLFAGIDLVFHLAALADIVPSIEKPMQYHHSNVNGTISVLEACRKHKVKRIIYSASSSCYGIPDHFPTPEDAEIRCQYPYAVTKYLGEEYCLYWEQIYKMNITCMRFFNVYGPKARTSGTYGAVFGVFLAQKLNNKPYTVVGDGKQTRDFTFVTDIVDACVTASKRTDVSGQIFNVGSGNTYSINSLVQLLGGEITYVPKRPGEPDCTFADTRKISDILKWKPKVGFEEGVKIMLANIDYWKEAPLWEPDSIAEATKDWFKYLGK
ncbi:MAG TPA: SDR family oxidoreductase [Bacteroidia bacterium]|jgi:UDP-glucose 4-epimerase|nr:SDR family oxidoreductase [Bacteroidia bacterium]